MKMIKTTCIVLFSIFLIFMISGCQKDSVIPVQHEKAHTKSASSKQHSIKKTSNQKKDNNTKSTTTGKKQKPTVKKEKTNSKKQSTVEQKQQSSVKTNANPNPNPNPNPKTNTSSKPKTSNNSTNNNNATNKTNTETTVQKTEPQLTVTISIVSNDLKKTIIAPTKVGIKNGDTVLTVTTDILKQKGIPIGPRGSGATAYVEGIGDLYEFDHGPLSGWTVEKNGVKLDRSAGVIKVKNGDSIRWNYTTDYTKDTK